jgi:Xaa-Pro aminopeptidase
MSFNNTLVTSTHPNITNPPTHPPLLTHIHPPIHTYTQNAQIAAASGCSVVRTYCGHGIGELFHTNPTVPHYPKNKAKGTMKPGHIFTIEPMINLGDWQVRGISVCMHVLGGGGGVVCLCLSVVSCNPDIYADRPIVVHDLLGIGRAHLALCMYRPIDLLLLHSSPPRFTHTRARAQCDTWPDEWTAVTRDGSRSAQFEHTILITEDGYEILTARSVCLWCVRVGWGLCCGGVVGGLVDGCWFQWVGWSR